MSVNGHDAGIGTQCSLSPFPPEPLHDSISSISPLRTLQSLNLQNPFILCLVQLLQENHSLSWELDYLTARSQRQVQMRAISDPCFVSGLWMCRRG